ncbi:MAG: hypothetical protein HQK77_21835, partial [Desulfobacterales bacterium]|nr:hypothetical protein [Desulfobacterales bacterium]
MKTFGQILVEKAIISEAQLEEALARQKKDVTKLLGQHLIDMGIPHQLIFKELDIYRKRKFVGQLLVDDKKITEQQLEKKKKKQRQTQLPL